MAAAALGLSNFIFLSHVIYLLLTDNVVFEYTLKPNSSNVSFWFSVASFLNQLFRSFFPAVNICATLFAIAQLIKHEFVDRVLTTNFDPLVVRACALVHEFPAVYDMAVKPKFRSGMVRDLAVFHLHGQRDGFVQLHKDDEVKDLKETLGPIFLDTAQNRTWIVAG